MRSTGGALLASFLQIPLFIVWITKSRLKKEQDEAFSSISDFPSLSRINFV